MLLAQGMPQGPEFQVNTYTTGTQAQPSVAQDSAGNFVVAWTSNTQGGGSYDIHAQRYSSTGSPLGGEFQVNTSTTSLQDLPAVASDSAGDFVVAWWSHVPGSGGFDVLARRYTSMGVPIGGEFRVNTYPIESFLVPFLQRGPTVASDSSGNFVVTWHSDNLDGSGFGVSAQRYAATGSPLGGEFRVNTHIGTYQYLPSVASNPGGNFVVTWQSQNQDGDDGGIFGQRYLGTGAPLGGEFRVNSSTFHHQYSPSVASDSAGNFVVAWISNDPLISTVVCAQRYDSTGTPQGGQFQVNTHTLSYGWPHVVSMASDSAGNFVIAWTSNYQDGSAWGVFAQRYANTGTPLGGEFRVNTFTTSSQHPPAVASDWAGNFVIVWAGFGQDESEGVFAQRFSMILPVELESFRVY